MLPGSCPDGAEMTETDLQKILADGFSEIKSRLDRIEKFHSLNISKEAYTVEEAAERLGRSPYSVRQWANLGCIKAHKVRGKGRRGEWRIPADEIARVTTEGPSPEGTFTNSTEFSRRKAG
jgi:excisionase family DNA binding protein